MLCTGQEPRRDLYEELRAAGRGVHLIGGADVAAELDAKRAIRQGTELAAALCTAGGDGGRPDRTGRVPSGPAGSP